MLGLALYGLCVPAGGCLVVVLAKAPTPCTMGMTECLGQQLSIPRLWLTPFSSLSPHTTQARPLLPAVVARGVLFRCSKRHGGPRPPSCGGRVQPKPSTVAQSTQPQHPNPPHPSVKGSSIIIHHQCGSPGKPSVESITQDRSIAPPHKLAFRSTRRRLSAARMILISLPTRSPQPTNRSIPHRWLIAIHVPSTPLGSGAAAGMGRRTAAAAAAAAAAGGRSSNDA